MVENVKNNQDRVRKTSGMLLSERVHLLENLRYTCIASFVQEVQILNIKSQKHFLLHLKGYLPTDY